MSSVAVASFRWLDALEKEFDTSFVDFDSILSEFHNESDNGELTDESLNEFIYSSRDKIKVMSSAWAQLVHKAQTIFEINCKQEAQILNLKRELAESNSFKKSSEKELEKLMIELHSAQLQLQKFKTNQINTSVNKDNNNSYTSYATSFLNTTPNVSSVMEESMDQIQKKLSEELEKRFNGTENSNFNINLLKEEVSQYKNENNTLKEEIVNLTSEVYGARLAAKYSDKELAGRIQQIQLFGKNLKVEEHELLWNQLEAEIHLHRHKTVIKACRSKRKKQNISINKEESSENNNNLTTPAASSTPNKNNKDNADLDSLKENQLMGNVRVVHLKRNNSSEGIGISITGGREHGVPILISEIHNKGPASRSKQLYVGDAILSVNNIDLKEAVHSEAVEILSNLTTNEIKFEVLFAALDDDSETESNLGCEYPYLNDVENGQDDDEEIDSISIASSNKLKTKNNDISIQTSLIQNETIPNEEAIESHKKNQKE